MNKNTWWIWAKQKEYNTYNDTIVAIRSFYAINPIKAGISITADSYYRLYINGVWIGDGPARAWPEQYNYDVLDLTPHLRAGENEIKVIARYFGCGTFHSIPQQAGLLAEIRIHHHDGTTETVSTDETWQVATASTWVRNTPKISIQMEPVELYDATHESGLQFASAARLFKSNEGPWKNLQERSVANLTLIQRKIEAFMKASIVSSPGLSFTIPHTRLMNPGLIEANGRVFSPFGIATVLTMDTFGYVSFESSRIDRGFFKVAVDGAIIDSNQRIYLSRGPHFVLGFARNIINNDKTISITLNGSTKFSLNNPLDSGCSNPWSYIPMREYAFIQNDMVWRWFAEKLSEGKDVEYEKTTDGLLKTVCQIEQFQTRFFDKAENLPFEDMFVEDSYHDFHSREEVKEISDQIQNPEALISDENNCTVIQPCGENVELIYDLGEQNCGYYSFEVISDAGVLIDLFAVEYISPEGKIQFTANNRNGFRYITKEGMNRYVSLKRRSGRYLFITLRNFEKEIRIRNIKLIESTYPVVDTEIFSCSDERLGLIADISARTLKLCMEDVYTDCPLYEQTLWVGDLRNEALFGYYAFGATDIARNSLLLAAKSTARYGMVEAQVPSCWHMILPAWSFLWGIASWEYFWYTGDQDFLITLYPHIIKNIQSAEKLLTKSGLFSAPYWNMFDWAKIDQEHQTVLHNSMLFVGALDAACRCAQQLSDTTNKAYFSSLKQKLIHSINRFWNAEKRTYPDSLSEDGCPSSSSSQHTSFLSLLYDIIEPWHAEDALRNLFDPPDDMDKVGSPFAIMYMYEALEKYGCEAPLILSIVNAYTPMLEAGATTVWESYPQGSLAYDEFPTRSHCHGWSAAPLYFFQRILLGIKQTSPGCTAFEISPNPCGLKQAQGTVKTPFGSIHVSWQLEGDDLSVVCQSPPEIEVQFQNNHSLSGYKVSFSGNGKEKDYLKLKHQAELTNGKYA